MCTRVLWNDNGLTVVVGRSMDWPTSTDPILTVLPRGLAHDGGLIGPSRIVDENPLTWTSTYGSLVTTVYGVGAADGLNERPYVDLGIYNTEYRTVCDLTNLRHFFELTTSPNVIWEDLHELDFAVGASVRTLGTDDIALSGEVSASFREVASAPY